MSTPETPVETVQPKLAVARATIHLDGLPFGATAVVDLNNEYVSMCLASGHLVVESTVDDD